MMEQQDRKRIQQALENSLSGLENDPYLAQRILNQGKEKKRMKKKMALCLGLALVLLLGGVAYAAGQWGLFDYLQYMFGTLPPQAERVMQGNLYQETINGVEITVKEAGYDGKSLFLLYTYRITDADAPISTIEEGEKLLKEKNVGWWIDQIWINGKAVDVPGNSGSDVYCGRNPGEIIHVEYWRLDNENVSLEGQTEIALPIGESQPLSEYRLAEHPEKYDAEGGLMPPEKGLVRFHFDAGDILSRGRRFAPCQETKTPYGTVQATESCFTPLMSYITLELQGDQAALAAYTAKNGDGIYDENGTLIFAYSEADVFADYLHSLQLTDAKGNILFPDALGLNGYGNHWAEFIFPYLESIPAKMYLAPVENGTANMEYAILVR